MATNPNSHCACTHLNVQPRQMVSLESMGIAPNNAGGNKFFYDRQSGSPFVVPRGWSFVVTDIIAFATPTGEGPIPNPNRFVLAVVSFTNGGERTFQVAMQGDGTFHFPLTGAFVIPAGHEPTFRNTTFSNSHAEAQLLGYFVHADGLGPGEKEF
ncbi:MAG: hypothetical protein M3R60_00795 [Pseudomonadota bacterium]|nr:hypothetical protein [Pseudomonadota bacterium]